MEYSCGTYLEHCFETSTRHKTAVDALFNRAAHANRPKVVEVKMTHIATRSRIMHGGD